jgi:hypothetical protein
MALAHARFSTTEDEEKKKQNLDRVRVWYRNMEGVRFLIKIITKIGQKSKKNNWPRPIFISTNYDYYL